MLWTKGKHNLTFGFQWQALQDNENTPLTGTQAGFTFSNNETANFNSTGTLISTTGLGYASYLLGLVDSSVVTQNSVAETGGRYKTYALYVQDDFKVSSRLTLNLGLRWNIWSPFTEVHNVMSFFNPTLANPLAGRHSGGAAIRRQRPRQLPLLYAGEAAQPQSCAACRGGLPVGRQDGHPGGLRHLLCACRRRGRAYQRTPGAEPGGL